MNTVIGALDSSKSSTGYLVFPSPWPPRWTYWPVLRRFGYQGSVGYGLISTSAGNRTRDLPLETALTWLCVNHSTIPSVIFWHRRSSKESITRLCRRLYAIPQPCCGQTVCTTTEFYFSSRPRRGIGKRLPRVSESFFQE